ncbi:hypothetical protein C8Q79DRAFT_651061 [Trametes meyenii]|nr:hypothetical protein C8Q79DRAFT_651061 [Trametes meyenii]
MVEYHLGLTPGVIVGLALVLISILAMLVATVVIVWRSRPSTLTRVREKAASADRKTVPADGDLESGATKPRTSLERLTDILKKASRLSLSEERDAPSDDGESAVGSPDLQTPRLPASSTVNLIISPSSPHVFQLAGNGAGGVEVRVTPPTPSQSMAALKAERRVRFETLAAAQGEYESVWWFI